jgi:hypothetical protein
MSGPRVPELAPSLGRLIVPRRITPPWVPLDDVREQLATEVIELAGAARVAAAADDAASAVAALAAPAWRRAWEAAVQRAAERVAVLVEGEVERAAWRVRMPRHRWRRLLLTSGERRAVGARLASGGGPFAAALDALEVAANAYLATDATDEGAHAAWQDALRTAARRLEAAWLALEAAADAERERWAPELDAVAAWRPRLWPAVLAVLPLAVLFLWLGLVLGGYLPAPAWLAGRLGF